jgi:hypothetical protein
MDLDQVVFDVGHLHDRERARLRRTMKLSAERPFASIFEIVRIAHDLIMRSVPVLADPMMAQDIFI